MTVNIGKMFANRALLSPNMEAFVGNGYRYTFLETNRRINRMAAYLVKIGISRGDRVATLCKNNEHVTTTMFAALKLGAVFVPVNFRLKAPEISYILNNCAAGLLVYDEEFSATVDSIRSGIPARHYLKAVGAGSEFESALASMPDTEPVISGADMDPAVILYTSGTTGNPKGAILSHNNLFWASLGLVHSIDWAYSYRYLSIAPLFHSGGLAPMMGNLHAGVTTVFMPDFDPSKVWQTIEKEKINFMMSVPAMLSFMLMVPGIDKVDLSSLKHVVCGGSMVPESLILTYKNMGIKVENVFGITEYTGAVTFWTHDMDMSKTASVGLPVFHGNVKICAPESEEELAPGEVGEICCAGPQVFGGYWDNPDATQSAMRGGCYRSGDLGSIDEHGYLYVVDRLKDMIVSGGENIYPAELERVIRAHPGVADVAVVGRADAKCGEVPVAFIIPKPGAEVATEEVVKLCKDNLASYKCVKETRTIAEIPRNALGKVLKRELRKMID